MVIYTCKPEIEDMLTCIYEAWASGNGHQNVRLCVEPVEQYTLFDTYLHVDRDDEKVEKVVRSIQCKLSYSFYADISYAMLSAEPDMLDTVYRVLVLGFAYGPGVLEKYQYREVSRFLEIRKRVGREANHFWEFLRFTRLENGLYIAHFEPKGRVLVPVSWHFEDRMPSESWIIVDDVHQTAVIHPKDEESVFRYLTEAELERLKEAEKSEDAFTARWKIFFENVAIKERTNARCQMNHFPKWMRKHVTEFQTDYTTKNGCF